MPVRKSNAVWEGDLKGGKGMVKLGSGAYEGSYSFTSRFEEGAGTNPEELIGAAHAGCFSMAFSGALGKAGFAPKRISTEAKVHIEKQGEGFSITKINLIMEADIPEISREKFLELAESAKNNCPVSKVLAGAEISLEANLTGK